MSLLTVLVERLKDKQIPVSKIHRRTKLTDACVVINDNLHIMIHQNNMFSIVKIDKKGRFHYSDIIRFLPVVVHLISQDFKKK